MRMARVWAMPSSDTFDIPPIGQMVKWYLSRSNISVDPFARNKRWATYTNDLNPDTAAEYHVDALEFLEMLKARGVWADLIIFDPPYSHYQAREEYAGFGIDTYTAKNAGSVGTWAREKELCYDILSLGGIFIHCGWHSNGMGKGRHCAIEEILLVAHGRAHNDTIVTVEIKVAHQSEMELRI